MNELSETNLQLRSLVKSSGQLEISVQAVPTQPPKADEVVIRIQASPINPSDLGILLGSLEIDNFRQSDVAGQPQITADISPSILAALTGRHDQSMPVGNEGAGEVIAAGDSEAAQALLGKTVAGMGGGMYCQYRTLNVSQCLVLNEGTTARQGAACFINPLTSLGMVETMKIQGQAALIHTAAASNLGQMLQKICLADGIPLINIVRKPEQGKILREIGATYVCNSWADSFAFDLKKAISETGAYIAFDATGGGELANDILVAMEAAASEHMKTYSRYGSNQHKQVYLYGGLQRSPTILKRNYGMQWSVGGWLLTPFLQRSGADRVAQLRQRVLDELTTTFASNYNREISLSDILSLDTLKEYSQQSTGHKFLVNPSLGN